MLIFYVDEMGNAGINANSLAAHPYFILGAMAIHDTERMSLCKALRDMKRHHFPHMQEMPWADTEIKGRYLDQTFRLHEKGRFPSEPRGYASLSPDGLRKLLDSLSNLVHRFRPVFYFVAVDKQAMLDKYPEEMRSPIGLAYAYLQQRAALLVEKVYGEEECAVFLADEHTQHEGLYRSGKMAQIREYVQSRAYRPAKMDLVLEKPIWLNKEEMPVDREITQLTDFALYQVGSAIIRKQWGGNLLPRIGPYIARHWSTGKVRDSGITIVPRPQRYPWLPFA